MYPFYFYPLHFMSPKYLGRILNALFPSSLPFSISPSQTPQGQAELVQLFQAMLSLGRSSLIFTQSVCTPLGYQDTTRSTLCCLQGKNRAIETKMDLPPPFGTTSLMFLCSRNCTVLPHCFFQVAQVPQFVSLPESFCCLHPKEGTHVLPACTETLDAVAQTGKIRS